MNADAAVHPHHDQQRALDDGTGRPQPHEFIEIIVFDAEVSMRNARIDDVREQQERDQQTKRDLNHLPWLQAQRRARGEFVERKHDMGHQSGQQDNGARSRPRHHPLIALHLVHHLDVDEADGVIEKMRKRESKQHQAGNQPRLLQGISARQNLHMP